MPDIQLRLNRDMLVMSTPIEHTLKAQGFSGLQDKIYVSLCEPELFEEAFKFESIVGTPLFCCSYRRNNQCAPCSSSF